MEQLQLDWASPKNEIQQYFQKILELSKSGNEFPVLLDDVWLLVYERIDIAKRELVNNFIEGIDYNLHQNAEVVKNKDLRSGIKVEAKLSVPCMEYFIARKNRDVFEVYRKIFHKVSESQFQLPQSFSEALQLAANQAKQIELQTAQIKELEPKAEIYESIVSAENLLTLNDAAKTIGIGRNLMMQKLRASHILMASNNPYQSFIDSGFFVVKIKNISHLGSNYTQTYVTAKGLIWLTKTIKQNG